MNKNFSYSEYVEIIQSFSDRLVNFESINPDSFVVLRHDVEFSVERAYEMACIEEEHGIRSTFLFQVMSNAYNPFSAHNKSLIRDIKDLGHSVGLHFYVSHIKSFEINSLESNLIDQSRMFELGLGLPCEVFSFHRPPRPALEIRENYLCGMINTYGPSFFEFSENPSHIKYVADSQHKWSYGHPLEFVNNPRVQLLVHPDEWTDDGDSGTLDFFQNLIKHKRGIFSQTIDSETKHFSEFKKTISVED